jgi:hypothetical protein
LARRFGEQRLSRASARRLALAECIRDRDAKAKATALAREAVEKANELVAEAERHAEAVKSALSSARDGREARLREAIEGGAVIEKPASTSQARFALDDAEDELEIARKVLATSAASLAFAIDAQRWAQHKVEAAVTPILTAETGRLLDEAAKLREQFDAKCATLIWLRDTCLAPGGDERQRINSMLPPSPPPGVAGPEYRPPADWIAAREALLADPDARLPSTP